MREENIPTTVTQERYDSYLFHRAGGRQSASCAFVALKAEDAKIALPLSSLSVTTKALVTVAIGIVTFCVIRSLLSGLGFFEGETLWIESPSGKTVKELPLPIALRVVRKRGWHLARVEPVKLPRVISRWEAFLILLFGDTPVHRR